MASLDRFKMFNGALDAKEACSGLEKKKDQVSTIDYFPSLRSTYLFNI
jgi:hypothetical protein